MEQHWVLQLFHLCVYCWSIYLVLAWYNLLGTSTLENLFLKWRYMQYYILVHLFLQSCLFLQGDDFFNQIVSPVKNFHVILGNLLQSLHYLLFSPVFFSFQQVSKCFCSTICNGKMFPISDTWRAAFVGQTRVSISLPVFPTDPIVFPATKRYLITMQYLVIFNISTLVSISLALVQLKKWTFRVVNLFRAESDLWASNTENSLNFFSPIETSK